jgi:hypothetical protein
MTAGPTIRSRIDRLICRVRGHDHEIYRDGGYHDRRGRWRERWQTRCGRCGCGPEILYAETWRSRLRDWRNDWRRAFQRWRGTVCDDCMKPDTRFGRPVGDHSTCDPIPF